MKLEKRIFGCDQLEYRGKNAPDVSILEGHAAVFDQETVIESFFGSFREKIAPGAFKKSIEEKADVRALFNHDPSQILGRTTAGTLKLREDKIGLLSTIDLPDTQLGRDVGTLVKRGDISQMSFGFIVRKEQIVENKDEDPLRIIQEAELFDVSPVTFPAFPTTDISARSVDEIYKESISPELKFVNKKPILILEKKRSEKNLREIRKMIEAAG